MKKLLTTAIAGAALAAMPTFVAAGSSGRELGSEPGAAPDSRGLTIVRAYAPNYQRGPRIIHVPPADERASVNDRDERRHIIRQPQSNTHPRTPRSRTRSAAPLADGPTPIRPLPRLGPKADATDKFGQPREVKSSASPPPAGDTPPTALSADDGCVDAGSN